MPRTPRATPPLLKDLNERTILEAIRAGAPISRAEISRRAGISKPTVSLALESLLTAGLVREAEHDPVGPSYGAVFFEPVAEAALVLGLDLGARFLRGALCDLNGQVRARQDVEVVAADADGILATIASLRATLVDASGLADGLIDNVVVGVPGVVETSSGRVTLATNVPGLEGHDFRRAAGERLSHPVVLENDINLAAIGEQWQGIARGVEDFVFISIGTGLGSGIVLRGEVHRGHNGAAGELDYARAGHEDFDPCASALSEVAAGIAEQGGATALASPYDARAVFSAARQGDAVAQQIVAEEARRIALHITPVAAVADVGLVVLGGGIGANADLLLQPVRALLAEWLPYPPRVEVSSLGEAAVLTGALEHGRRAALESVFENSRDRRLGVSQSAVSSSDRLSPTT
ncbi:MAG TPA: ROK family transcriptional regulator [Gaiellaceae bacterium]|jgi:predicted NBD/HSP70 family sugar kinase|nr:ROK family transcriptional regulator [Gaiellaceae bacterium]